MKDVKREELFQCIREVYAGKFFIPPSVAAKLAGRQSVEDLTPRELEVLRLLAEGKPNKLIASAFTGGEFTLTGKSASHVLSLLAVRIRLVHCRSDGEKPRQGHIYETQCIEPYGGHSRGKPLWLDSHLRPPSRDY